MLPSALGQSSSLSGPRSTKDIKEAAPAVEEEGASARKWKAKKPAASSAAPAAEVTLSSDRPRLIIFVVGGITFVLLPVDLKFAQSMTGTTNRALLLRRLLRRVGTSTSAHMMSGSRLSFSHSSRRLAMRRLRQREQAKSSRRQAKELLTRRSDIHSACFLK